MAQELTPADFNKPCLMTYGEIAERLFVIMRGARPELGEGASYQPFPWTDEQSAEWAKIVAAGLLKLSTEDVR